MLFYIEPEEINVTLLSCSLQTIEKLPYTNSSRNLTLLLANNCFYGVF